MDPINTLNCVNFTGHSVQRLHKIAKKKTLFTAVLQEVSTSLV